MASTLCKQYELRGRSERSPTGCQARNGHVHPGIAAAQNQHVVFTGGHRLPLARKCEAMGKGCGEKMRSSLGGEGRPQGGNLVSGEGRVTRTKQMYIELPKISLSILLQSFDGCAYFWRSGAATLRSAQTPPGGT